MTLPATWRAGLACIGATVLLIAATTQVIWLMPDGGTPGHAETATTQVIWLMPDGGTPGHPTYDQLELDGGIATIPCGTWAQGDWYLREEAAVYTADHKLTDGEDHPTDFPVRRMGVISWDFYYGGNCAPHENQAAQIAAATHTLAATGPDASLIPIAVTSLAILALGTTLLIRARRNPSKF